MGEFNRSARDALLDLSLQTAGQDSKNDWRTCSPQSLRGHIVKQHLAPRLLLTLGVPRYDIEVAEVRRIGLGWVVKKAFERLQTPDEVIEREIGDSERINVIKNRAISPDMYRVMLAKTIRVIADKNLAHVPWPQIDEVYEGASSMKVDFAIDTSDGPFDGSFIQKRPQEILDYYSSLKVDPFERNRSPESVALSGLNTTNSSTPSHPDYQVKI